MKAYRPVYGLLLLSVVLVAVAAAPAIRLPKGKDWIDLMQAMATPSVALLAAYFTWKNYHLTRAKRKDDLFDRRYGYFTRLWECYVHTGVNNRSADGAEYDPDFSNEDRFHFQDEAAFLFGPDIVDFVRRLPSEGNQQRAPHCDVDFITPFKPYLALGR